MAEAIPAALTRINMLGLPILVLVGARRNTLISHLFFNYLVSKPLELLLSKNYDACKYHVFVLRSATNPDNSLLAIQPVV